MVSMARPFLADADFVNKAAAGRADEINTCIACNQACLDHTFAGQLASCLVNPRACHETELVIAPAGAEADRRGGRRAGRPGGATTAAERGHAVTLFEAAPRSAASSTWPSRSPARRSSRDLRYFRRRSSRPA
jgi:2,4-dienoyl-CoA reductase (NADPH2)